MNKKEVFVVSIVTIITLVVIVSAPLSSASSVMAAATQAQEKEKFFMSFKLANPQPSSYYKNATAYDISDIISNNMNKSFTTYMHKKIQFNLKDTSNTYARISDSDIDWRIPFTIIDTSTPNIIRSQESTLGKSLGSTSNLVKEYNILTNITTYTGESGLLVDYSHIADLDVKATIYPNATGVMELRQK